MAKILVVEDDLDLCGRVVDWLTFERHTVEAVHDGQEGSDRLKFHSYDLAILDWDLPQLAGIEICRRYRSGGGLIPLLMLTGKSEILEKEEGLDAGADDYLTKPFDMRELSARVRALVRRQTALTGNVLKVREFTLDTVTKKFFCGQTLVTLSPKEFAVIEYFMRHPDEVFSQELLLERVWSSESEATVFSVYTAVKTLRKKTAIDGIKPVLATVHGLGYRLDSQ